MISDLAFLFIPGHTHILSLLLMRNQSSGSSAGRGGGEEGDRIVQTWGEMDKLHGNFVVLHHDESGAL